jgi:hypothetical protein
LGNGEGQQESTPAVQNWPSPWSAQLQRTVLLKRHTQPLSSQTDSHMLPSSSQSAVVHDIEPEPELAALLHSTSEPAGSGVLQTALPLPVVLPLDPPEPPSTTAVPPHVTAPRTAALPTKRRNFMALT